MTVTGDLSALGAATFVIGYLSIGRMLRSWMPLYLYAAPVTGIAALLLSLAAIPISPARPFIMGTGGLVGWLLPKYLPRVGYQLPCLSPIYLPLQSRFPILMQSDLCPVASHPCLQHPYRGRLCWANVLRDS